MAARVPPQNTEAEQSILGSLMLDSDAWDRVADLLDESDFYKPSHQKIFSTIKELHAKNQPIDLITISNMLQARSEMDQAGGTDYLVELVNRTVSSANVESYATIVREKSLLRKVIVTSSDVIEKAYGSDFTTVDHFIDEAEEKFYRLGEQKQSTGLKHPIDLVKTSIARIEDLYKRKAEITGLSTGFSYLDKMTSGLHPGELTIIAARPSMGKTALSLNIAQHIAIRQAKSVAYFSLEMDAQAMMMRILASESRISMGDIRSGRVSDSAWPKLIHTAGLAGSSSLFIDDTPGISPLEIRARARRLKAHHGLDCVMIDYLQMMKLKEKVESREREVSEISRTLKALAKELQVPVVAMAQLNRGVEGRTEKRPMLSDLRESGSIEQDADVIMMLYREDYYDKDDPEKQGHAEIIIGKQRNGPTGTVKLRWEAEYGRFRDADNESSHPLPPPPPTQSYQAPPSKPKNFAPGANA